MVPKKEAKSDRHSDACADRRPAVSDRFLDATTAARERRLNPIDIQAPTLITGRRCRIGFLEVATAA